MRGPPARPEVARPLHTWRSRGKSSVAPLTPPTPFTYRCRPHRVGLTAAAACTHTRCVSCGSVRRMMEDEDDDYDADADSEVELENADPLPLGASDDEVLLEEHCAARQQAAAREVRGRRPAVSRDNLAWGRRDDIAEIHSIVDERFGAAPLPPLPSR